jgi:ABC-type dipeptide/oligopeptide/nickel transport system permease component
MIAPPTHARPLWLPARLWLGSAAMATLFLLAHGGPSQDALRLVAGFPLLESPGASLKAGPSLYDLGRTLLLLGIALITAFTAAVSLTLCVKKIAPFLLRALPVLGHALAAAPIFGLLWIGLSWWIGTRSGAIETLLPERLPALGEPWQDNLARHLWAWLAPALALATPLAGVLLARFADSLALQPHAPLVQGLRSRGLRPAAILNHHLIPILLPSWTKHLEAGIFLLLLNTLVVESVLLFPGWGLAFITALRSQQPLAIACGIYTTGLLAALLCLVARLFHHPGHTRKDQPPPPPQTPLPSALVPALAFIALIAPAVFWIHRQTIHHFPAWQNDALAVLQIVAIAALAGPVLAALRLTILGDWLRRYGLLESLVWSPLPLWALAWSHAPGSVVSLDQSLSLIAAIHLSIQLHHCTRRTTARTHLTAAKALGATPWQAWRRHALRPWVRELTATLLTLAASTWWLRILSHSLLPPARADPSASLGGLLATAATDALQSPLPILTTTLIATVSILSLWTLSRIIHPHDDL